MIDMHGRAVRTIVSIDRSINLDMHMNARCTLYGWLWSHMKGWYSSQDGGRGVHHALRWPGVVKVESGRYRLINYSYGRAIDRRKLLYITVVILCTVFTLTYS